MRLSLLIFMLVTVCSGRGPFRRPPPGKVGDCQLPRIYHIVCGSDGFDYVNPEEVVCARRKDRSLRIVNEGKCTGPPPHVGVPGQNLLGVQPPQQTIQSLQPEIPQQHSTLAVPSSQQSSSFQGSSPQVVSPIHVTSPAFQSFQQGTPFHRPTGHQSPVVSRPQLSSQYRPSSQQNLPVFGPPQPSSPVQPTVHVLQPASQTFQQTPVSQQPTGQSYQGQLTNQQPSRFEDESIEE
ncbi:uncharacterized protein LOC143025277 isoform X2 [Oratosquilla oratoria]|uniref:uncharacterized protein LOC143025277 isoform X2 n=1 Tax=Oratosquilla oratoria TaxID=337810 RepID=UPI003F7765DA